MKKPKFIIGVEQQPAESFSKWKTLGVNTLVNIPNDPANPNTEAMNASWVDSANRAEMYQIRKSVGSLLEDSKNPYLLAWSHDDEPDLKGIDPQKLIDTRKNSIGYNIPWFVNFSGGVLLGLVDKPKLTDKDYAAYIASSDIIGHDIYPVSGWDNSIDLFSPQLCIEKLETLSCNRSQLVYVECSRQNLAWLPTTQRSVTSFEMEIIIEQAIQKHCCGIVFFPHSFNPFKFDATTPEIKNAISRVAKRIG